MQLTIPSSHPPGDGGEIDRSHPPSLLNSSRRRVVVQKRRDMAQELLLEKFEGLASKAKLLEGEKAEAVAKIQDLEREIGELKELISLAESKVDEMLGGESAPDVSKEPPTSKAQVTSVSLGSKGLEELVEDSTKSEKKTKRRFTNVF